MSPIHDIQPRVREVVRIRTGERVAYEKDGETKTKPVALKTWGFSAAVAEPLERLAAVHGGEVVAWDEPASDHKFKVTTLATEIACWIPPTAGFSQWYEMWSGGGCQRRCNGERELLTDTPCACAELEGDRQDLIAKGKACRPTTRLTVVLKEIGEMAGARLESHGYNAAVELASAESLYTAARKKRIFIPGLLRLEERTKKRPGRARQDYVVPNLVIRTEDVMAALDAGPGAAALIAGAGDDALIAGDDESGRPIYAQQHAEPVRLVQERRSPRSPVAPPASAGAADRTPPSSAAQRSPLAGLTDEQLADMVMKRITQAGLREEEAAELLGMLSDNRTKNIKAASDVEVNKFFSILARMHTGTLELEWENGLPRLVGKDGEPVSVVFNERGDVRIEPGEGKPFPSVDAWKALQKGSGVTTSALLRRAREMAAELRVDVPSALDGLTNEVLATPLAAWLEEQRTRYEAKEAEARA